MRPQQQQRRLLLLSLLFLFSGDVPCCQAAFIPYSNNNNNHHHRLSSCCHSKNSALVAASSSVSISKLCRPFVSSSSSLSSSSSSSSSSSAVNDVNNSESGNNNNNNKKLTEERLKSELTLYLEKRQQVNADEAAKQEVGKVIGGTKGNAILNYVSGSPNKEQVVEEAPNVFDYDELTKYGFGHLVTPIMEAGGRLAMYELMDMPPPPPPRRVTVVFNAAPAKKIVMDRTGETDPNRYSGLKLGQVLDDDTMARALQEAQRKSKEGQRLRPILQEEEYVMPFADKRNVSPNLTPDWTPERLDEYGKARGRALAWARRAQEGEFVSDPFETLLVEGNLRWYSILAAGTIALGLGKSTPTFLQLLGFLHPENNNNNIDIDGTHDYMFLQAPALVLLLAHVGSSLVCGVWLAGERERNRAVWAIKGLLAGPLAVSQLRGLNELITRRQQTEDESKQ